MTDDRKEIVQESADEFKLDELWGEDWNAGEQAVQRRYRIGDPMASLFFFL